VNLNRREVVTGLAALAVSPVAANEQSEEKTPRIAARAVFFHNESSFKWYFVCFKGNSIKGIAQQALVYANEICSSNLGSEGSAISNMVLTPHLRRINRIRIDLKDQNGLGEYFPEDDTKEVWKDAKGNRIRVGDVTYITIDCERLVGGQYLQV
jgi:hypothetical protein